MVYTQYLTACNISLLGYADFKTHTVFFNVLLTMNHAMILGNCPTWRTNSFQCIYLFI